MEGEGRENARGRRERGSYSQVMQAASRFLADATCIPIYQGYMQATEIGIPRNPRLI